MECAGLIYDDSSHYLDHLAPLCSLLQVPLILCDPLLAQLAHEYYPDLTIVESSLFDLKLPQRLITCDSIPFIQAAFPHQKTQTFWLPHGNSDKGWDSPFFEGVGNTALVYGQKMIDFMHAKQVYPKTIRIGNFRWHYFLKHRAFYEKKMPPLSSRKKALYAPTWDDSENNCSFWTHLPELVTQIPENWELWIKLHPNTLKKYEAEVERLIGRYANQTVHFLPAIPPIYPLLAACSAYIGDMSSIGYDFLTFDKPLYFCNRKPHLPLHRCGLAVQEGIFHQTDSLSEIRKATYTYTFDEVKDYTSTVVMIQKH